MAGSKPLTATERFKLRVEYAANRRFSRLGSGLYRLTKGRIAPKARDVITLTTTGRTSGHQHMVLLQAFPDGLDMVLVAANSGRRAHPDWYLNLVANPLATVQLMDCAVRVHASTMTAHEAGSMWPHILAVAPSYDRHARATAWTLPLVRLTPEG